MSVEVLKNETAMVSETARKAATRHRHVMRPGHEDHQLRHSVILMLIFATIIFSQIVLVAWKKRSYASYMLATLVCLWLVPVGLFLSSLTLGSLNLFNVMFIALWVVFTLAHTYIYRVASQKPLSLSTPKTVNTFFYFVYQLCFGVAAVGFIFVLLNIFFFQWFLHFKILFVGRVGFSVLFFGLYFGLMGRDFAEYLSGLIANEMGYASRDGMPSSRRATASDQACGICQGLLRKHGKEDEPNFKLSCGHTFHTSCVRGWTVVGKKDICPVCAEKVNLSDVFDSNIWSRKSIVFAQLLDSLRYLLVWNPLIVLMMQLMVYFLD